MLAALIVMSLGAIILGGALGYAAVRFRVKGDPLTEKIDAILPQTQCGQCGFAGCSSSTLVAFTFRTAGANTGRTACSRW